MSAKIASIGHFVAVSGFQDGKFPSKSDIKGIFRQCGPIKSLRMYTSKRVNKKYLFLEFSTVGEAKGAIALDCQWTISALSSEELKAQYASWGIVTKETNGLPQINSAGLKIRVALKNHPRPSADVGHSVDSPGDHLSDIFSPGTVHDMLTPPTIESPTVIPPTPDSNVSALLPGEESQDVQQIYVSNLTTILANQEATIKQLQAALQQERMEKEQLQADLKQETAQRKRAELIQNTFPSLMKAFIELESVLHGRHPSEG